MRFGSVCSGIEAASVAWHPLGWRAAWLSEIEPFPCAVLAHHYPDVPNLGDMTALPGRIQSGEIEAPDVFCGGTPCQAFSVAGLRKSLDDARGNLSLIFCEIANAIDTIRAQRGQQPATIFWENVPGVLSTKDNAFGCFLAGLAGEDDPLVAPGDKWSNAGCVFGPTRTVAWRTLDAQYFGVAQRRRRVFVVASARKGFDPCAVLFEFDGVRRDSAPRREAREVAPTTPARSLGGGGLGTDFDCDGGVIAMAHGQGGAEIARERRTTLTCNHEAPIAAYATVQVAPTMRAGGNRTCGDRPPGTDVDTADSLIIQTVTHSLRGEGFDASEDGSGRGTPLVPVLPFDTTQITSAANYSNPQPGDPCHPLAAGAHAPAIAFNRDAMADQLPTDGSDTSINAGLTCSQAAAVAYTTKLHNTQSNQAGKFYEEYATSLDRSSPPPAVIAPVSVSLRGREGGATAELGDEVGNCLRASGGGGDKAHVLAPVAITFQDRGRTDGRSLEVGGDVAYALTAPNGGGRAQERNVLTPAMQVRRLTPVECERLQGFPDGYTQIPWRKNPATDCPDGHRYKALGNSWAVPNVRWIGRRIQSALMALEHANDNTQQSAEVAA